MLDPRARGGETGDGRGGDHRARSQAPVPEQGRALRRGDRLAAGRGTGHRRPSGLPRPQGAQQHADRLVLRPVRDRRRHPRRPAGRRGDPRGKSLAAIAQWTAVCDREHLEDNSASPRSVAPCRPRPPSPLPSTGSTPTSWTTPATAGSIGSSSPQTPGSCTRRARSSARTGETFFLRRRHQRFGFRRHGRRHMEQRPVALGAAEVRGRGEVSFGCRFRVLFTVAQRQEPRSSLSPMISNSMRRKSLT